LTLDKADRPILSAILRNTTSQNQEEMSAPLRTRKSFGETKARALKCQIVRIVIALDT